jgi:hypothetical protein
MIGPVVERLLLYHGQDVVVVVGERKYDDSCKNSQLRSNGKTGLLFSGKKVRMYTVRCGVRRYLLQFSTIFVLVH